MISIHKTPLHETVCMPAVMIIKNSWWCRSYW